MKQICCIALFGLSIILFSHFEKIQGLKCYTCDESHVEHCQMELAEVGGIVKVVTCPEPSDNNQISVCRMNWSYKGPLYQSCAIIPADAELACKNKICECKNDLCNEQIVDCMRERGINTNDSDERGGGCGGL